MYCEGYPEGTMNETTPALFLDRDGVINEEVDYLWKPEDVRFVSGIHSLCRRAQSLGYKLIVVTNQAGIGRGLYTEVDFHTIMGWMKDALAREEVHLDGVYFCPYHPTHGLGEFRREHEDRKPAPGMLLRAAEDHSLDLAASILVGDRCTDIAAAEAAGLRQAFLLAGTEAGPCGGSYAPVSSLAEVENWLTVNGSHREQ